MREPKIYRLPEEYLERQKITEHLTCSNPAANLVMWFYAELVNKDGEYLWALYLDEKSDGSFVWQYDKKTFKQLMRYASPTINTIRRWIEEYKPQTTQFLDYILGNTPRPDDCKISFIGDYLPFPIDHSNRE